MINALCIIGFVIAGWAFAYHRVNLKVWSLFFVVYLVVFCFAFDTNVWMAAVLWSLTIPVIAILNIPWMRSRFLSKPLFTMFKRNMPAISETEYQALAAGDVWWEKELFSGQPDWDDLFALKKPTLSKAEREFLDNQVETLCDMLDDWQITQQKHDLPPKVWNYIKKEKFFGLTIDKKYQGLGFSAMAHSAIITKITSRSYSAAVDVMVPNSLGPAEFIQHYGTQQQKEYYLPRLADGREVPCFALTGPLAGSDASSIPDTGVICEKIYKGKKTIGLKLNWHKRYITLAPVATLAGVAVYVRDPDHFLSTKENVGISFCLVPTDLPGIEIGSRHAPLNMAFMNGPIVGKDVFVPLDHVIGGQEMLGKGWEMMMSLLAVGRGISLPAVSCGTAELSYRMTGAYARVREQFNQPIGRFEGVQEALARIGGYTYMCEAVRALTVSAIDSGKKPAVASAIAKYHLTEMSRKIINDAMDIHAGRGIMVGLQNYLANLYIAAPINITVEGANILTRNLIIFGQGAVRCHPFIAQEMVAANNPDAARGLARFDHLIFEHLGYLASNIARSLWYSVTMGLFIRTKEKSCATRCLKQLTRMSTLLATLTDVIFMTLGGEFKRRESISARLGDVLSNLYIAAAVLKYFKDHGQQKADEPFVDWCVHTCLYRIEHAFDNLMNNIPNRFVVWCMRRMQFFWGKCYQLPRDKVGQQIAQAMMQDTKQRDRLTQFCYIKDDKKDAVRIMDTALSMIHASTDIRQKMDTARSQGKIDKAGSHQDQLEAAFQVGIITSEEMKILEELDKYQQLAIMVDDFATKTRKSAHGKA